MTIDYPELTYKSIRLAKYKGASEQESDKILSIREAKSKTREGEQYFRWSI